jgi:hypothetical protein
MWLLHFLPDSFIQFVVHLILVAGIIGTILSFFVVNKILMAMPMLSKYVNVAQIVSALLLVAGVYFEGGYATEMQWRERVRELEAKVAEAEAKSAQANVELEKKIKEKTRVVKEIQVVVKERIVKQAAKIDSTCVVDPAAISILNDAAKLRTGTVTVEGVK